jgi:hypothetical protein
MVDKVEDTLPELNFKRGRITVNKKVELNCTSRYNCRNFIY